MLKQGLFITATDTGAGKTFIGTSICAELFRQNKVATPRKPIESGCDQSKYGLIANDANAWYQACNQTTKIEHICKYAFEQSMPPDEAARLSGSPVYLSELVDACKDVKNRFILVEGAGGFYTPLCEDGLNADLAQALDLPVLIVVKEQIGTINQALLTIEAIQQRELGVAALVLNQPNEDNKQYYNNYEALKRHQPFPVFSSDIFGWEKDLLPLIL